MHKAALAVFAMSGVAAWGQAQTNATIASNQIDRASAYYHYTLAHMYAELAGSTQNRNDYINQAIANYKEAIKADPSTPMLSEELSEIYIGTGRLREAESDANDALKKNPNDVNALRLLARIYTRQIGDGQQNRVDEAMLRKAIDEYQRITKLDARDTDSWLMLGRLQNVSHNSVEAQNAFKEVQRVPALAPLYQMLFAKYGPTTLGEAQKAISWSTTVVTDWLKSGMFAVATLDLGMKPHPVVPTNAVLQDDTGARVFVVANAQIQERLVQLGQTAGDVVGVLQGVKAGDNVVVSPGPDVRDGARVE